MKFYLKLFFHFQLFALAFLAMLFACKTKRNATTGQLETQAKVSNSEVFDAAKFKNLFFEATKEKMKNNFENAFALFKQANLINPKNDAVNYELANISRSFGKYQQSIEYGKAAKSINPINEWYRLLLIDCYHAIGKYKESSEEARDLVARFPENKNFYLTSAQEYLFAKNLNASLEMYNLCLKKFGADENIAYNKVQLLMDLKKYKDAEDLSIKLFKEFPRDKKYFNLLEEIYRFTDQKGKALSLLEEEVLRNPEDPYLHLTLADYYRQEKQTDKAFKEIAFAFDSPELPVAEKLKILVSFYNMTDQYPVFKEQGIILCKKFIDVNPNEGKAHAIYADFLIRDQKLKEGVEEYIIAIETEKENYFLWSQLLIAEAQLNDIQGLNKHAGEALELFPNQPVPYYFKGFALSVDKKYKEAVDVLNEGKILVVDNNSLSAQFLSTLGDAYNALKDFPNSERNYDEALLLDPKNEYVLNNFAYYLSLRKDKLEKAEKMSKLTLDLQPENINYLDTYAWILFQQGKYEDAKIYLQKAVSIGTDKSAVVFEHYGDVLFKLNDTTEAIKYWELANSKGGASEMIGKKLKEKKYYE
jgi:tetratricopeptide (TPR) repeat protein